MTSLPASVSPAGRRARDDAGDLDGVESAGGAEDPADPGVLVGARMGILDGAILAGLPAVWLRYNCPCALCRDPVSGQRRLDITPAPAGLLRESRWHRVGRDRGRTCDDGRHPQEGPDMNAADPVRVIADLFAAEGAGEYLGEAVTQAQHMLQAAALAEGAGAAPELVAAALLHDVGHFTGTVSGRQLMRGTDNRHGDQGADWLAQWFGPGVTEPVRLHVAAKRYLCAVEPGYFGGLSAASVHTLRVQGGPMTPAETAEFEASPWCQAALRLRRWDDAAKDPEVIVPAFGYYQRLLRQLVRQHEAGAAR